MDSQLLGASAERGGEGYGCFFACQASRMRFSLSSQSSPLGCLANWGATLAWMSGDSGLYQSRVAFAVSGRGRNFRPLASARLMLQRWKPAVLPLGGAYRGNSFSPASWALRNASSSIQ